MADNARANHDLRIQVIPDPDSNGGCVRMRFDKPVPEVVMSPQDAAHLAMAIMRNAAQVAQRTKKNIVIPNFGLS